MSKKMSKEIISKLICPLTKALLKDKGDRLENVNDSTIKYPVINGIPVLINDSNSVFSVLDFVNKKNTTFNVTKTQIKKIVRKLIPTIGMSIKSKENYDTIITMLKNNSKILVIGGSIIGKGMEKLYSTNSLEIIGSDVSFGPYTQIIIDAHDIAFEDETFDCVIFQAVLEHVVDPYRCVSEAYRVLKPKGIIYSETPFMQQVHMREYDYTRFTHLGHRRLFNYFEEIKSGPTCGPGMALAWSYKAFITSFATSRILRKILEIIAHFTSFFLKYFDYYLIDKPGSYDTASGFYFLGKKSTQCLSDTELLKLYKGAM
ncbi:methyltransferase type 11 [bacterium B13(2017)]|nr:methyltransferase type 11 [bacterium B13(2017)]